MKHTPFNRRPLSAHPPDACIALQTIPLGDPCWLPAFAVKLRDQSKCICPMRSYKSVTVTCSEPGAFDVKHVTSGSATHEMALGKSASDAAGPLEYDDVGFFRVNVKVG